VIRLASAVELKDAFKTSGMDLSLADQQPTDDDALMAACENVLKYSVRTGHPHFFNQLYARGDFTSIAGDWLVAAANTNVHTFEVAPVFTVLEEEVKRKVASILGPNYTKEYDGLFVPGGSLSNLYGLHLARHRIDPEYNERGGHGGPKLVMFTSDQSHYSYLKGSRLSGIGSKNLIEVKTDERGQMCPKALDEAIQKSKADGGVPFFVGATAGTTVLGAYDPFNEIAEVCEKHDIWFHIDACWGGSALLSRKWRHLLDGADRAQSIAWNPHKMLGTALQSSLFLVRDAAALKKCNGTNAAYLFQPDKANTELDVGDKTIQCGRKPDMFKLWLQWKKWGDEGLEANIDHCFDLANYFHEKVEASDAFCSVYPVQCTNVCFWYLPPSLRGFNFETATQDQLDKLDTVAPRIKEVMQGRGNALIGFQAINGRPNFFRIVFANCSNVTKEDVDDVMNTIDEIGRELS